MFREVLHSFRQQEPTAAFYIYCWKLAPVPWIIEIVTTRISGIFQGFKELSVADTKGRLDNEWMEKMGDKEQWSSVSHSQMKNVDEENWIVPHVWRQSQVLSRRTTSHGLSSQLQNGRSCPAKLTLNVPRHPSPRASEWPKKLSFVVPVHQIRRFLFYVIMFQAFCWQKKKMHMLGKSEAVSRLYASLKIRNNKFTFFKTQLQPHSRLKYQSRFRKYLTLTCILL